MGVDLGQALSFIGSSPQAIRAIAGARLLGREQGLAGSAVEAPAGEADLGLMNRRLRALQARTVISATTHSPTVNYFGNRRHKSTTTAS